MTKQKPSRTTGSKRSSPGRKSQDRRHQQLADKVRKIDAKLENLIAMFEMLEDIKEIAESE